MKQDDRKKDMPHSVDAERGVIGSILIDMGGHAYDLAVKAGVTEETFHTQPNKILFACIKDMGAKGYPLDPLTLTERLRENGRLDEIGGVGYIQSLIDRTPTSAHIEYYISILADKQLKRKSIEEARRIEAEAFKGDKSGEMIRAESESRFAKMQAVTIKERRKIGEIARDAVQAWEDNANGIAPLGIQTGIKWLDDATAGILQGSYWVISGRPGSCKSTLCRMIAESVASRGIRVTVKTTEQTEEQYIGAMIAAQAKVSVHQLNCPGFPASRMQFLRQAESVVASWPLDIDGEMCTRSQLSSWYSSSVARGSQLQILDYLQDVIPETKEEAKSPEQKVSLATQEMRRQAKSTHVPIVLVSTESNDGALRYSGQTEYDASLWVRMSKADDFDPYNNPRYEAEIKKSRFSPAGTKIDLYYLYGALLESQDYYTQIAVIKGAAIGSGLQAQQQIP